MFYWMFILRMFIVDFLDVWFPESTTSLWPVKNDHLMLDYDFLIFCWRLIYFCGNFVFTSLKDCHRISWWCCWDWKSHFVLKSFCLYQFNSILFSWSNSFKFCSCMCTILNCKLRSKCCYKLSNWKIHKIKIVKLLFVLPFYSVPTYSKHGTSGPW